MNTRAVLPHTLRVRAATRHATVRAGLGVSTTTIRGAWMACAIAVLADPRASAASPSVPAVFVGAQAGPSSCQPAWIPTFGAVPGVGHGVNAMVEFDDGTGLALYVAGSFRTAGGIPAERIAKWDGVSWSALGGGLTSVNSFPYVSDLAVFDDGSGPALFAAGTFAQAGGITTNGVARWDGTSWSSVGYMPSIADSLEVYDDGTGPALYTGPMRWNGVSWQVIGGFNSSVRDLIEFDDGTGLALYAGGYFTTIGGAPIPYAARWNGTAWVAANTGLTDLLEDFAIFDDGTGPALYAAGRNGVVRWNGASWTVIPGSDISRAVGLGVYDDGSGSALYVGVGSTITPAPDASRVRRWDGTTWSSPAGIARGGVGSFLIHDDGSGPALFVGGTLTSVGGQSVASIAKWSPGGWSTLGAGGGIENRVRALAVLDDGSRPALHVALDVSVPGQFAGRVARWDGSGFEELGGVFSGTVYALEVADFGAGEELYAAGGFATVGGQTVNRVARWNGTGWSPLGGGITSLVPFDAPYVQALLAFDDGTGPALYATGCFPRAGTVAAANIAKWNGTTWSALGSGLGNCGLALAAFDSGTGPALYAGGVFTNAGGSVVNRIARWSGTTWSALASGIGTGSSIHDVQSLVALDDGTGPALYVGGTFPSASGVPANSIARWNGTSWSALGTGFQGLNFPDVTALAAYDDGAGPRLYTGGTIVTAGGSPVSNMARWDPTTGWSAVGGGVAGGFADFVLDMKVFDNGSGDGPGLFVGGGFAVAYDSEDGYLAQWQACPAAAVEPFCAGDGSGSACPCANSGGEGRGCANSIFAQGARLALSGRAHVSNDTLVLAGSEMPDSSALYFQGTTRVNSGAGSIFGDGLRCAGGAVIRLGIALNASNRSIYPEVGDQPVSVRGGCAAGDVRTYQVWYRNAASFCTSATFNLTNGLSVTWGA